MFSLSLTSPNPSSDAFGGPRFLQRGVQCLHVHRFGEMRDKARFRTSRHIRFLAITGERDSTKAMGSSQLLHQIAAVSVGQPDIRHHQRNISQERPFTRFTD